MTFIYATTGADPLVPGPKETGRISVKTCFNAPETRSRRWSVEVIVEVNSPVAVFRDTRV